MKSKLPSVVVSKFLRGLPVGDMLGGTDYVKMTLFTQISPNLYLFLDDLNPNLWNTLLSEIFHFLFLLKQTKPHSIVHSTSKLLKLLYVTELRQWVSAHLL